MMVATLSVEINPNVELNDNLTTNFDKRGFHEEAPLFYIEDHHPGEFFWSEPYYPSRTYIIEQQVLKIKKTRLLTRCL